jgi:uncharacterized protein YyaL (SSP411 family)
MQSRALSIAENIVSFIEKNMFDSTTMHLNRTWRNGHPGPHAQADDYAFFIRGAIPCAVVYQVDVHRAMPQA